MYRKGLVVLITFLMMFTFIVSFNEITSSEDDHDEPIFIDGNEEFIEHVDSEGWPGSGTEDDPYIIQGYEIDGDKGVGIKIESTTVHFIIRDSYLSNWSVGISIEDVSHCTITDCTFIDTDSWIGLDGSSNNEIIDNTILGSGVISISRSFENDIFNNTPVQSDNGPYGTGGIYLDDSERNNISGNIIIESGIHIRGDRIEHWSTNHIDSSNMVNNKPVIYWKDRDGGEIPQNAGQVILVNCTNVTVKDQDLSNTSVGLSLIYSSNNEILNNAMSSNNWEGLYLFNSNMNTINGNTISSNLNDYGGGGIKLLNSHYNTIHDNTCNSNYYMGITLSHSNNNNISYNAASRNFYGIDLEYSNHNDIYYNHLSSNEYGGIVALYSIGNYIIGNEATNCGIYVGGKDIEHWILNEIDNTNIVNNKPVYFLKNQTGGKVTFETGLLIIANCSNITVENLQFKEYFSGIIVGHSKNMIIRNITVSDNGAGFSLNNVNQSLIYNNTIVSNRSGGIRLGGSCDNMIYENTISLSGQAVGISCSSGSNNNSIINNYISSKGFSGISIERSHDNIISGNIVNNEQVGIDLYAGIGNKIMDNTISSDSEGVIRLYETEYTTIKNNTLTGSGISIEGESFNNWASHDIDDSNTINGRIIYFLKDMTGGIVPPNAGQVFVVNSSYVTIGNLDLSLCPVGITTAFSSDCIITGNKLHNNTETGIFLLNANNCNISGNSIHSNLEYGIELWSSNDNVFYDNVVVNNGEGIYLARSNGNTISGNNISKNMENGISIWYSDYGEITYNVVFSNLGNGIYLKAVSESNIKHNEISENNHTGLHVESSDYNDLIHNDIHSNKMNGIYVAFSWENVFHHNKIQYNEVQLDGHDLTNNKWSDGKGTGNYWSDYTGFDTDGDGIGETNLPHQGVDNYPITDNERPDTIILAIFVILATVIIILMVWKKRRKPPSKKDSPDSETKDIVFRQF